MSTHTPTPRFPAHVRTSRPGIPEAELAALAPTIAEIERLKAERNAVVLAHNYMTPDIFHTVADFRGDSLQLAQEAAVTDADVIVMAGVHFMAETAKILSPEKLVLIPDARAGCSLAEGITGADVRRLREQYPGSPVVAYVNSSADVKAEVDVCCTSSNAVAVVESLDADRVIFVPDQYLGRWVASQTDKDIVIYDGACMVHERFTGEQLRAYRSGLDGAPIIAHPECPPDVLAEADFVGSTSGMINWVRDRRPDKVMMITECSMSDNVAVELPEVEFVRPCNLCPHMKRITLDGIRNALATLQTPVEVPDDIAERARRSVERMLDIAAPAVVTA